MESERERLWVVIYEEDYSTDFVLAESEDEAEEVLSRVWAEHGKPVPAHRIEEVPEKNAPYVLR